MAKRCRVIGARKEPTNWANLIISAVFAGLVAGVLLVIALPNIPWATRGEGWAQSPSR